MHVRIYANLYIPRSFMFLISLLISGLFYIPLKQPYANDADYPNQVNQGYLAGIIIISVTIQELARYLFIYLFEKGEDRLHGSNQQQSSSNNNNNNNATSMRDVRVIVNRPYDLPAAIASGFGFGMMSSMLMYGGGLLGLSLVDDPQYGDSNADYFLPSCTGISIFLAGAISTLGMQLLHISLMVLMLDAARVKSILWIFIVYLTHLAASLFTMFNNQGGYGCAYGVTLLWVVVILSCIITFFRIRKSLQ